MKNSLSFFIVLAFLVINFLIILEWINVPSKSPIKKYVYSEEFLDSYLFNNLDNRISAEKKIIVIGHSAGYYIFPKSSKDLWKFENENLDEDISNNYIGLFSGGDYPIIHLRMLNFIHEHKKLYSSGDYLFMTLTDVPLGDQYQYEHEKIFFDKWHNFCGLFEYTKEKIEIKNDRIFFFDWRICKLKRFASQARKGFFNRHNKKINSLINIKENDSLKIHNENEVENLIIDFQNDFQSRKHLGVSKSFDDLFRLEIKKILNEGVNIIFIYLPQGSPRQEFVQSKKGYAYFNSLAIDYKIPFWDYYDILSDNMFLENDFLHVNSSGAAKIQKKFSHDVKKIFR